jgi:GT2 family glycosyltransferase
MEHQQQSPLTVSVIIPTKNRPGDLVNTIRSLFLQSVRPYELVVVDQTPSDDSLVATRRLFADAQEDWSSIHYLHEPEIAGVSMARNRAMQIASGEIWLFLDDDVILEPLFVEALLDTYKRYPESAGVSGVVTNYKASSFAFRAWSWLFARGPFYDERQSIYWHADDNRQGDAIAVQKFGAGLMSFRAQAIRHLRFDLQPHAFPAEDIDFCAQLDPDSLLLITPRARLAHLKTATARVPEHWLCREVRVSWYMYRRHWKSSFRNQLCFWWLQLGYACAAGAASLRHLSLSPWSSILSGVSIGRSTRCD